MEFIMIFLLINFYNPKQVILGTWISEKFKITLNKIVKNKVYGVYKTKNQTIKINGLITESIWDQPCSKAYECELSVDNKKMTIKFIGYQNQIEINGSLFCEGNFQGSEALIINSNKTTFLYKK